MGLGGNQEGVLSHVVDLVVGIIAALIAWAIFAATGQAIWSLLLLLVVVAAMVWYRTRGTADDAHTDN